MQNFKPNFTKPNIIVLISETLFNIKKKLPKIPLQFICPKHISQYHKLLMYYQNIINSKFIPTHRCQVVFKYTNFSKVSPNHISSTKSLKCPKYLKT